MQESRNHYGFPLVRVLPYYHSPGFQDVCFGLLIGQWFVLACLFFLAI